MKPLAKQTPLSDPDDFRSLLISWFNESARTYPWRQTVDPYAILVSEVMLQQTQIATVLERGFYARWMTRFPDLPTLAAAEEEDVLKCWEGLGYYRRARNLLALARQITRERPGDFPRGLDEILSLPGVGRYTAGAIASFAYNDPAPIVDGNVARVFARLFDDRIEVNSTAGLKRLWAWAAALVSPNAARLYNSALMELGQRICLPKRPRCLECPVARCCATRDPETLPVKKPGTAVVKVDEHSLFHVVNERILLIREQSNRRLGLWRFPERSHASLGRANLIYQAKYSITHHRVTLRVYRFDSTEEVTIQPDETWVPMDQLTRIPMGAPYRKSLDAILADEGR